MTLVIEDLSLEELGLGWMKTETPVRTPGPVVDGALEQLTALMRQEGDFD